MQIQKALRSQTKMKIALQGPSGSGKTYSALLLAHGLSGNWNKTVVIDSENGSSNLYAHLGDFNVIALKAPYSPEKFISAINLAESSGMETIILDSISLEWDGQGGILDIHGSMAGNSFTNWSKVTPRHNAFVQAIVNSNCHVISTIRAKQDYVLTEKNGKHIPEKVGLKGVTRDGMDYEFTVVLDLDIKHFATASKDRTGLFADKPSIIIDATTGMIIRDWCKTGSDKEMIIKLIKNTKTIKNLVAIYNQYPNYQKELEVLFTEQRNIIQADNVTNELNLKPRINANFSTNISNRSAETNL